MASLQLNHIYKVYPNGTKAVNDFSMNIEDKEFIVFVGPSGCGKSTTLRMIAGLEEITAGELRIGDLVVNDVEPKDRDIAMVFQNYALYPHMTVYENMAFGLRLRTIVDVKRDENGEPLLAENGNPIYFTRKYTKEEIDSKITEAARILGITEYLERRPKEMSGGQRQRVALGRAIVRNPKVMLLDEPLSNLDAKLRTAMRSEISKLHHKLQTTFIYVTHDQVEAMTMGTRIVVMKDGFVQQIDTPRNLYRFPANKFVAGFIGTPQMNFFEGTLTQNGDKVVVAFDNTSVKLEAPISYFNKADRAYLDGSKTVLIGIRAEHVSTNAKKYPYKAQCRVSHVEELGTDCQVYADFNLDSEDIVGESPTRVIVKAPAGSVYDVDEVIDVSLDLSQLHVFDPETENTIAPRIPKEITTEGVVTNDVLTLLGNEIALPEAIRVENGVYGVTIPTNAVSLGGAIAAEVTEQEDVNGQLLLHLKVSDRVLFAIVDKDAKVGKKVKIHLDLKQIALTKDGEIVVAPLNCDNALGGALAKRKVVKYLSHPIEQPQQEEEKLAATEQKDKSENTTRKVAKLKKYKELGFFLDTAGSSYDCSRELAMRLINGGGQHIFGKPLELHFTPYQVSVAQPRTVAALVEEVVTEDGKTVAKCRLEGQKVEIPVFEDFDGTELGVTLDPIGIKATVEQVLNYGTEIFAVCRVGDTLVNVAVDKDFNAEEVTLALDVEQLAIVELARGIRLA